MIKKVYYSTLNDEYYEKKSEAQKAEDRFVEAYFKDLDERARQKRAKMNQFVKPCSFK